MTFIHELKKRNVFRVAVFYVVSSWVILQAGSLLIEVLELPVAWTKLMLVLLVIGFPVALIVSWIFEITPEGLQKESDISATDSTRQLSARRMNIATIVVVLLGVTFLSVDRYFAASKESASSVASVQSSVHSEKESVPIIAVLPFSASGSDDGGFLASGLHDDLLTRLAQLNAFRVISRTSMMEYADTTKNMRQIGRELGAGYVLEGGVQALGVRVRINAQLIDAQSDEHLWAKTYDRELTAADLFDIQAEMARAIADELSLTLSGSDSASIDRVPTRNTTAYNAYLRALELGDRGGHNAATNLKVITALERAVETDPNFAEAWAQLSIAHSRYYQSAGRAEHHAETALAAHARALALNPSLPEGIVADAVYKYRVLSEYGAALERLQQLEQSTSPPASVLLLKAFLLRRLGHFEQAYQTMIDAYALDPRSIGIAGQLIEVSLQTGRCEEAGLRADAALARAPKNTNELTSAVVYEMACTGNLDRAHQLSLDIKFLEPWHFFAALRVSYARSDFDRMLELSELVPQGWLPQLSNIVRAEALLGIGQSDAAERLLDAIETQLFSADSNGEGTNELWLSVSKMQLFGLRNDSAATLRWIDEHKRLFAIVGKGDKNFAQSNRVIYAQLFAEVGLKDKAVAELEEYFESPGALPFLYNDVHPSFRILNGNPGYEALRIRYSK